MESMHTGVRVERVKRETWGKRVRRKPELFNSSENKALFKKIYFMDEFLTILNSFSDTTLPSSFSAAVERIIFSRLR